MRVSIKDWFKSNKININKNPLYVMCVDDGYNPHFVSNKFYLVNRSHNSLTISSPFNFRVSSLDDNIINKLFIPIQGVPEKLTKRDKLLIKIRTNEWM